MIEDAKASGKNDYKDRNNKNYLVNSIEKEMGVK